MILCLDCHIPTLARYCPMTHALSMTDGFLTPTPEHPLKPGPPFVHRERIIVFPIFDDLL